MSFTKVRNAHKTENTEDYLELIDDMLNKNGEARIVDIANKFANKVYITDDNPRNENSKKIEKK